MDQLVCPLCDRDYELPRRFLTRPDDIEFLAVPRILGCLHTCCQSCLEEMWQKNGNCFVCCPQCRNEQKIKGVRHLPLDGSALSHIIPLDGSSLSLCSRCHDEVPSFSWCGTCSAAYCQFHHQDHKLSVNTSNHEVITFKDITRNSLHIEPCLPPITCPEELDEDANLYCRNCCHLVSAQGMLTKHNGHSCVTVKSIFDDARNSVESSIGVCQDREEGLVNAMKSVRNAMYKINEEREFAEKELRTVFDDLKNSIQVREEKMIKRLNNIAQRKKLVLTTQLDEMSLALDNTRHCIEVAERLLKNTSAVKGAGPYVVSASDSIATRCDYIEESIMDIPFEPQVDPIIRVSFVEHEIDLMKTVVESIGAVVTRDNIPSHDESQSSLKVNDSKTACTGDEGESKAESLRNWCHTGQIAFTLQTSPPPKLSVVNRMASSKESVVVEIRMVRRRRHETGKSDQTRLLPFSSFCEDESFFEKRGEVVAPGKSTLSLGETLGEVVGHVVLLTEVDKTLSKSHTIRTHYESFLSDLSLPTLRLTREVVND